ncbi:MAG TPA: OmpA family protein [Vicinamibacterales bacterium]|nr:OmpA family protein [Vicinamibacterales bacterium]
MRPTVPGSRAGADRWMVSYADLVTLLFAFFTTLYAGSTMDSEKMAPVASSLEQAFATTYGANTSARASTPSAVPAMPLERPPDQDDLYRRLARVLGDAIAARRLELMRDARGLVISLPDDATFAVGSADLAPEAKALIATVGDAVRTTPNPMRIEGHTDDTPIRTARYGSNWELSTARASSVVAYLVGEVGIEAGRLSAAGYGQYHPRNPNDSEGNRARNRRVDLVILDMNGRRALDEGDAQP